MKFVFRIDDVSPYMNWENFDRLLNFLINMTLDRYLGSFPIIRIGSCENSRTIPPDGIYL